MTFLLPILPHSCLIAISAVFVYLWLSIASLSIKLRKQSLYNRKRYFKKPHNWLTHSPWFRIIDQNQAYNAMKWFTYQTGYTKTVASKFVLLLCFTNITTVLCFVISRKRGRMKDLPIYLCITIFLSMQFKIEGRVRISLKGEKKL